MSFPIIPERIKLFGRPIEVNREDMPTVNEGEETWGCWHDLTQTIKVNEKIPPGSMAAWTTLVHEVIHAIDSIVAVECEMGEKDVDRLAAGFLSFLIENDFLRELPDPVKKRKVTKDEQ